jgi:hypothetical protein
MVWKHVVQIESIDASGFVLWANGIRVFIIQTLLAVRRFRDTGEVAFRRDYDVQTRLRVAHRLSRIAHFCQIAVVVKHASARLNLG